MNERLGIVHVANFPTRDITDGGSMREEALDCFLAAHHATRLTVHDEIYQTGKVAHINRLPRLLNEIDRLAPSLVVLNYPSYPFMWQHRVTPCFFTSLLFAERLHRLAIKRGFKVVVDIMDLPVFQYQDLGFNLEMSPDTLKRYDRYVFDRADILWVCSGSIARLIHEQYGIDNSRIMTVLNGYSPEATPKPDYRPETLKLAYAGSLNPERGLEPVINAFASSPGKCEMHLCGSSGEWIERNYSDPRIIYHGALTDSDARKVLSDCHVGLIPYPERGYYQLAFATKLAFYLGIGLPVLCSDVAETGEYVQNTGIGLRASLSNFADAIRQITESPQILANWREQVVKIRGMFSWSSIYELALLESFRRAAR